MYSLTKYDLKIMRYLNQHKRSGISRTKLLRRFKGAQDNVDRLANFGYISHDYVFPKDPSGFRIGDVPGSAIYHIENSGIAEVESRQWFDLEYVISHIVVPIVLAIITTLITLCLSALL